MTKEFLEESEKKSAILEGEIQKYVHRIILKIP